MGFLDQLWGDAQNHLGDQQTKVAKSLLSSLGGQGEAGEANGLTILISQFEQAGLGEVVRSWVSNEAVNKDVTPDQVHKALGEQQVQQLADQAGMPKQALLVQLATFLPKMVDALTPNGQVPHAPQAAGQRSQPSQMPGDAESAPVQEDTNTAEDAVEHTDPTEPVQSASGK